ncbi:hypothetical protein ROS60_004862 [Pluralibacter gergoviae]|nr:hypothetical protein [Pluralibacter gergoviae]ELK5596225.1 hypothetical protein [Pluralibacter gergoviae]
MLDIAKVLKERDSEFISLRELISRIRLQQPHVDESQVADFLYIQHQEKNLGEWVKQGIAKTIEPTDGGYEDVELESLLKAIHEEKCVPEIIESPWPKIDFDDDIPF